MINTVQHVINQPLDTFNQQIEMRRINKTKRTPTKHDEHLNVKMFKQWTGIQLFIWAAV